MYKKPPTIKDVANLSGVSISTVSQYLNQRYSYMSDSTKKEIKQAISMLNYTPNSLAQSMIKKKQIQ